MKFTRGVCSGCSLCFRLFAYGLWGNGVQVSEGCEGGSRWSRQETTPRFFDLTGNGDQQSNGAGTSVEIAVDSSGLFQLTLILQNYETIYKSPGYFLTYSAILSLKVIVGARMLVNSRSSF